MSENDLLNAYIQYNPNELAKSDEEDKEKADIEASTFWKPDDGENVIRILPPPVAWVEWFKAHGKTPSPFFSVWKHYWERPDTEEKSYVSTPCPSKMLGLGCEACSDMTALANSTDQLDKAMAKKMEPKHRCMVNVIDRNSISAKPLLWEISYPGHGWNGKTMYEKLKSLEKGRNAVDLVHPITGCDIVVTKTVDPKLDKRMGTSYKVEADRNTRSLNEDSSIALMWINSQSDVREYVECPNAAQMHAILSGVAMSPAMLNLDGTLKEGDGDQEVRALPAPTHVVQAIPAQAEPTETAGDFIASTESNDDDLPF